MFLRFTKNFTWLFLFNSIGYLLSFIVLPLLISKYGLKEVGIIFTIQSIILGIAAISNYSFVYFIPTVSKEISQDDSTCHEMWNLVVNIRMLFSIVLALIGSIIVYYLYNDYFLMWVLSLSILLPKIISPSLFCNALEVNKYVFIIGFFTKFLFLLLIVISNSSLLVNLFFGISEFVVILFFLKKVNQQFYNLKLIPFKEIFQFLQNTFNLFLVNFFSMLKPHSILPFISATIGNEFAALFTLADKIINVIKGVSGTVFISFFPIYNKGEVKFDFLSIKNLILILVISLLLTTILWNLSPMLIYYLNNLNENASATKTLQMLSLSIPMLFLIIPFFSYLLQKKYWNAILFIVIIQLIILIIGLFIFKDEEIIGVAKSLVLSEYTLLICYVLYVFKTQKPSFPPTT
ncbi:MATE family efflux transporter [Urechidicola croceus]|uniref:Polysaccharide biosynthesis protein C-terminal domain-containing protein n=1 Tax=Urechidicola croceus TaxID=1850246 RepID=A0A1D8PA89_9FLAO|nr:hypothetical protein [Urechidicola croceus]AOW21473.1 hypothetical protein LPB138_12630 [Urechidicola croceus]